jgi:hypothetical protein
VWREALFLLLLSFSPLSDDAQGQPSLTNKDISLMKQSGLSDEVIIEKVRGSPCDFNTSPAFLADLKTAGISDSVILEMVRCDSRSHTQTKPNPEKQSDVDGARPFGVSFVKHPDRRWRYGWRSERYDDISDYLLSNLVKELGQKGLRGVESSVPAGTCCFLTIELLEVNTRRGFTKVGIDVTANITVADSGKQTIYFKEYQGESKTVADSQWWHIIHHAVDTMVRNMADDEQLRRVLESGKR